MLHMIKKKQMLRMSLRLPRPLQTASELEIELSTSSFTPDVATLTLYALNWLKKSKMSNRTLIYQTFSKFSKLGAKKIYLGSLFIPLLALPYSKHLEHVVRTPERSGARLQHSAQCAATSSGCSRKMLRVFGQLVPNTGRSIKPTVHILY